MAHHRLAAAVELPGPGQLVPGDVSTLDRLDEPQQFGGDEEPPAVPAWAPRYTSAAWAATVASPAMSVRRGWR